jgi:hypothetical protein
LIDGAEKFVQELATLFLNFKVKLDSFRRQKKNYVRDFFKNSYNKNCIQYIQALLCKTNILRFHFFNKKKSYFIQRKGVKLERKNYVELWIQIRCQLRIQQISRKLQFMEKSEEI